MLLAKIRTCWGKVRPQRSRTRIEVNWKWNANKSVLPRTWNWTAEKYDYRQYSTPSPSHSLSGSPVCVYVMTSIHDLLVEFLLNFLPQRDVPPYQHYHSPYSYSLVNSTINVTLDWTWINRETLLTHLVIICLVPRNWTSFSNRAAVNRNWWNCAVGQRQVMRLPLVRYKSRMRIGLIDDSLSRMEISMR